MIGLPVRWVGHRVWWQVTHILEVWQVMQAADDLIALPAMGVERGHAEKRGLVLFECIAFAASFG